MLMKFLRDTESFVDDEEKLARFEMLNEDDTDMNY